MSYRDVIRERNDCEAKFYPGFFTGIVTNITRFSGSV